MNLIYSNKTKIISGFLFIVAFLASFFLVRFLSGKNGPVEVVARVYTLLATDQEPYTQSFFDSSFDKTPYFSQNFINRINNWPKPDEEMSDTDPAQDLEWYDPVVCAQDIPNSLSWSMVSKTDNKARVDVVEHYGEDLYTIPVDLILEDGVWKIDQVDCSNLQKHNLE